MRIVRHRVLIADDHSLVRSGMKQLVAGIMGDTQFVEAHSGDSLAHAMGSIPMVNLALVDLKMPGMQGEERLMQLAARYPSIPIVVISAFTAPDLVRRVMSIATVYAFAPKSAEVDDIRAAIGAAMHRRKLSHMRSTAPGLHQGSLTPRQAEIQRLLRAGLSNKRIAAVLGISEGTVKNHITEIFRVLNATNRTQAAQLNAENE